MFPLKFTKIHSHYGHWYLKSLTEWYPVLNFLFPWWRGLGVRNGVEPALPLHTLQEAMSLPSVHPAVTTPWDSHFLSLPQNCHAPCCSEWIHAPERSIWEPFCCCYHTVLPDSLHDSASHSIPPQHTVLQLQVELLPSNCLEVLSQTSYPCYVLLLWWKYPSLPLDKCWASLQISAMNEILHNSLAGSHSSTCKIHTKM